MCLHAWVSLESYASAHSLFFALGMNDIGGLVDRATSPVFFADPDKNSLEPMKVPLITVTTPEGNEFIVQYFSGGQCRLIILVVVLTVLMVAIVFCAAALTKLLYG